MHKEWQLTVEKQSTVTVLRLYHSLRVAIESFCGVEALKATIVPCTQRLARYKLTLTPAAAAAAATTTAPVEDNN